MLEDLRDDFYKRKNRKVRIVSISLPANVADEIDRVVTELKKEDDAYSRSSLITNACQHFLKKLKDD